MTEPTTSLSPLTRRTVGIRGLSAVIALAVLGASLGTTTAALAQQKPAPKAAAAKAAKADKKKATPKDPKKEAGLHFKKGADLFAKKQWKESKAEYEAAEELFPGATPKYFIARCSEELGEHAEAAAWYDKAIELNKLKPEQQKDAQDRVAALKARPAKLIITSTPPGALVIIDGKAIPEKTPTDVELTPGAHKVALSADKMKPFEQSVDVAPFKGAELNASLEAQPPPPPPTPVAATQPTPTPAPAATPPVQQDARQRRDNTWVYVTGAAAIVGLGVGTYFGVRALNDHKDYTANNYAGATQELHDRGTRDALVSDMGFGLGVTLAITSAVLYFTQPPADAPKKTGALRVTPVAAPGPNGGGFAGATASFTF